VLNTIPDLNGDPGYPTEFLVTFQGLPRRIDEHKFKKTRGPNCSSYKLSILYTFRTNMTTYKAAFGTAL